MLREDRLVAEAVDKLLKERTALVAYAHMKLDAGDYHAVADAAMDLREIDAALKVWARA